MAKGPLQLSSAPMDQTCSYATGLSDSFGMRLHRPSNKRMNPHICLL